jgi:hypothetical protein
MGSGGFLPQKIKHRNNQIDSMASSAKIKNVRDHTSSSHTSSYHMNRQIIKLIFTANGLLSTTSFSINIPFK